MLGAANIGTDTLTSPFLSSTIQQPAVSIFLQPEELHQEHTAHSIPA